MGVSGYVDVCEWMQVCGCRLLGQKKKEDCSKNSECHHGKLESGGQQQGQMSEYMAEGGKCG